jgi:cytochrome P450
VSTNVKTDAEVARIASLRAVLDAAPKTTHWGAATCPVTDFHEALEVLRSKSVSADCGGPGDEYYRAGTVLRIDAEAHQRRRRTLGLLWRRRGHEWFRRSVLVPTAEVAMAKLLSQPDPDGAVRIELRGWLYRVNMQLAAALVGLDAGRTPEGADDLADVIARHLAGFPGAFGQTAHGFDPEGESEREALRAHDEFVERFYRPAYERRVKLLRRVEAGELDEQALPHDLITLIVRGIDPALDDDDLAVREAIFLVPAAASTTATTTVWTLDELFSWFEETPEDYAKRFDSSFLNRAVDETLRLHPITPGQPRLALEDIELCKGTKVKAGDLPTVLSGPGNLDPEIFGSDAHAFNPSREVPPGVPLYGLSFGGGPHMCPGIPLALGQEGIDGNVVFWLKTLFKAEVQLDPDDPAPRMRPMRGVPVSAASRSLNRQQGYPVMFGSPKGQ